MHEPVLRFSPPDTTCRVRTFREGLLSGLGHDLELAVTVFAIEVDEGARTGTATFDAASLRVVRALRDGVELLDALSAADRTTIEVSIRRDVLDANRHPVIRFDSTMTAPVEGGWDVTGVLALAGAERPLAVPLRLHGARWEAEVWLHTPDWGIRPYRALLGALRVKADVVVRLSLPAVPPA